MEEKMNKYGISAAFVCAIAFFVGYINPIYAAAIFLVALIAGFSMETKKAAASAFVFYMFITLIYTALSYLSGWYMNFCGLFADNYSIYNVISKLNLCSYLSSILHFVEFAITVFFVIRSLCGKTFAIPVISKITNKFVDEAAAKAAEKKTEAPKTEETK